MRIRKARQILKGFAEDTRLRIINLLSKESLNVSELCNIIEAKQSNISKHSAKLRLTGVVGDRRKGFNVYYHLTQPANRDHRLLINGIINAISKIEVTRNDIEKLREIKRQRKYIKK